MSLFFTSISFMSWLHRCQLEREEEREGERERESFLNLSVMESFSSVNRIVWERTP